MDNRKRRKSACKQSLERSGFKHPTRTAGLLFDAFLENNGKISPSDVKMRSICSQEKFRDFIEDLTEAGFIDFGASIGYYVPGVKMRRYIKPSRVVRICRKVLIDAMSTGCIDEHQGLVDAVFEIVHGHTKFNDFKIEFVDRYDDQCKLAKDLLGPFYNKG